MPFWCYVLCNYTNANTLDLIRCIAQHLRLFSWAFPKLRCKYDYNITRVSFYLRPSKVPANERRHYILFPHWLRRCSAKEKTGYRVHQDLTLISNSIISSENIPVVARSSETQYWMDSLVFFVLLYMKYISIPWWHFTDLHLKNSFHVFVLLNK